MFRKMLYNRPVTTKKVVIGIGLPSVEQVHKRRSTKAVF